MQQETGIIVPFKKGQTGQMSMTRNHQGVIADVSPYAYVDVQDIYKEPR